MIKIAQDTVSQNFTVSVVLETSRETFKVSSQIARILGKHGVVSVSTKNAAFELDFTSYNDEMCADDVLWTLVDMFNVGYGFWDYLGIYIESDNDNDTIQTNKDGSTIKVSHKNAHKLKDDDDFPYNFAGGLQFVQFMRDTVRIDFPGSHESALQIYNDLQDLLNSLD